MQLEIAGGLVDLERPRSASALLVLTHGAGGGVMTKDVLAVRAAATAAGIAVALVTQPFRVAGRSTPPAPAVQDDAWCALIGELRRRRGLPRLPLILGGRSNGARVACRTAGRLGAVGVLALAFPLHPPGRPDKSRLDELDLPDVPVLVIQGERDPFGMPPPAPGRIVEVIARGDHNLRADPARVADLAVAFVTSLVAHARVEP